MPTPSDSHPSDDEMELYVLGRLDEVHSAPVEEHLLVCEPCRQRLEDIEEYTIAMRQALVEMSTEKATAGTSWWQSIRGWFATPMPVWAGAVAVLLVLTAFLPIWRSGEGRYEAELKAMRGETATAHQIPADRTLDLKIDATGLPALDTYRVEIAETGGQVVLATTLSREGETLLLSTEEGLDAGQYWVRIHKPQESGALLREFSLRVQ